MRAIEPFQRLFLSCSGLAQVFHCYASYLKMCGQVQTYPPVSKRGYLGVMPDVADTSLFRRAYRGGGYAPLGPPRECGPPGHPDSVAHLFWRVSRAPIGLWHQLIAGVPKEYPPPRPFLGARLLVLNNRVT